MMKAPKLFLDSGAFSLFKEHSQVGRDLQGFFKSKEFRAYAKAYATFVKENEQYIDVYANIDVIGNPELSWEILKYLENEHGLNPCPVIHYGTDLKWLDKHLEAGYDLIALGGMAIKVRGSTKQVSLWLDRVFERCCPPPSRLPSVRLHGFGVTTHSIMVRYPWWSVDSTTWCMKGAYGMIHLPKKVGGKYDYLTTPHYFSVSSSATIPKKSVVVNAYRVLLDLLSDGDWHSDKEAREANCPLGFLIKRGFLEKNENQVRLTRPGRQYITRKVRWFYSTQKNRTAGGLRQRLSDPHWRLIEEWLDHIGVPLGNIDPLEYGVVSNHRARKLANVIYFKNLADSLPDWPWSFVPRLSTVPLSIQVL